MFGKILSVYEYTVEIENISHRVESSFVGVHIVFEDQNKVVAEITRITCDKIECVLVGEFINNKFFNGIVHKPGTNCFIRIVNKEEVMQLVGDQIVDSPTSLYIGKSMVYEGFNVSARIDDLFSNHYAILGNTGSGKSCTVSRLFQNLFYRKKYIPNNAHIALFDVYGEYHTSLERINQTKFCRCKYITTDVNSENAEIVKIPPYFLEVDDLAILLNATSPAQLPIIEKALKYVYLFTEEESKVRNLKNNIIAKALLDILTSGKSPAQVRDQIVAVLTTFKTADINLNSEIVQPGYVRTLRQCLTLDNTGKINTIQLVTEFIENFVNDDLKLTDDMKAKYFTLKDLYNAFEFALISEGVLKSDKVYDVNNILKVRLDNIINSYMSKYFEVDEFITKDTYIKRLFTTKNGEKAQIINFNLNYIDERFAKTLTKVFSKLFLDYAVTLPNNNGFSVQIVLEEAHRYVQNDTDVDIIGYNIFDRITKEGRKYGVLLGLITQRPSEISNTALSQCSNYIVLRMFHPDDLAIVKNITHSISESDIEKLKALGPGSALCFGNAFNMPMFTKIDIPDPPPSSTNVSIAKGWFTDAENITSTNTIQGNTKKETIEIFQ